MSVELMRRGFKFVGPTICYAFMQAAGLVNDHLVCCFRYDQIREMGGKGANAFRQNDESLLVPVFVQEYTRRKLWSRAGADLWNR